MKNSAGGIALVLSGGAVRGAYAAGVVRGIIGVLGLRPDDRSPFEIYAGSSVGAINGAFMVANADRGDLAIDGLVEAWRSLDIERDLIMHPMALLPFKTTQKNRSEDQAIGRSFIDARLLESIVDKHISFERLHANIRGGSPARALVVSALEIGRGRTHLFLELRPGSETYTHADPRRFTEVAEISVNHILASASIPFLFPARRIGEQFFCDGGLRFNTPMAPAIRLGADRLVVISVRHQPIGAEGVDRTNAYPDPVFLLGKVMNALLLDSIAYDLSVLERFNKMLEILETNAAPEVLKKLGRVTETTRGAAYRRVQTLVFTPGEDAGVLAAEYLKQNLKRWRLKWLPRRLLNLAHAGDSGVEADLASYFLFDGGFADQLMTLGERDVDRRRDEVLRFFDS